MIDIDSPPLDPRVMYVGHERIPTIPIKTEDDAVLALIDPVDIDTQYVTAKHLFPPPEKGGDGNFLASQIEHVKSFINATYRLECTSTVVWSLILTAGDMIDDLKKKLGRNSRTSLQLTEGDLTPSTIILGFPDGSSATYYRETSEEFEPNRNLPSDKQAEDSPLTDANT